VTAKRKAAPSERLLKPRPIKDTGPAGDRDATNEHPMHPAERLNDLAVIAEWLGCSIKTVRRLIDRGELGYYRVGRRKRVSDAQYAEYLARTRRGASGNQTTMK
jgi:excisionase family DNA binding protein